MKRLEALNGVRALATIGIFLFHSGFLLQGTFPVTLFFMLSGFMMYYTKNSLDRYANYKEWMTGFFWRKLKQFYPLHFVTFVLAILVHGGVGEQKLAILFQLTLTQSFVPEYAMTFNGLAWYLSITMFLYLVGWFLIKIVRAIKIVPVGLCVIVIIIQAINLSGYNGYTNPFYRILDFTLGMLIARAYMGKTETLKNASFWEIICAVVFVVQYFVQLMLHIPAIPGYFTVIFTVALYIFAWGKGCISKILSLPILQKIAYYSFEFYMVHELALRVFRKVFVDESLFYPLRLALIAIPSLVISCILAIMWKNFVVAGKRG